jgi:hypothetical protein
VFLNVRFQKPKLQCAGEADQQIVGIGVTGFGGRVDRGTQCAAQLGIAIDQRGQWSFVLWISVG